MKLYDRNRISEEYKDIIISEWMFEVFEAYWLPCAIIRNISLFHWCWYVYVDAFKDTPTSYLDEKFYVHWWITYNWEMYWSRCIWFDCAHAYDIVPNKSSSNIGDEDSDYRTKMFAAKETARLARQVYEYKTGLNGI